MQLAGGKKVQEVLTRPGVLERFLCDQSRWKNDVFSETEVKEVRQSWMGMWGLEDEDSGDSGIQKARSLASSLVLKPQLKEEVMFTSTPFPLSLMTYRSKNDRHG
jgi:hypothetical protein